MSIAGEMEVTLVLRRQRPLPDPHKTFSEFAPRQRQHLSTADFSALYGAGEHDLGRVRRFADESGLQIREESRERRTVVVAGKPKQIAQAFGSAGAPALPQGLAGVIEAILGLHPPDDAPRRRSRAGAQQRDTQRHTILETAKAYEFPEEFDGSGECIGLIELGGGFHQHDIEEFCASLELRAPRISCVFLHGAKNEPASAACVREFLEVAEGKRKLAEIAPERLAAAQCTVEVTMDVELAAALAPGARIVVYFAPMTEQGIHAAFTRAIHDEEHRPSVLSYSWGEPENRVAEKFADLIDEAMQAAAHMGITVCASSGDGGAMNDSIDRMPTVNFPASSPYCLGCGGTTTKFEDGAVVEERVWNATHHGIKGATGGGVSRKFPLPAWQRHAQVPEGPTGKPGRGVPDVAGPADPRSGCEILVAGERLSSCGTSAVVPLWAALIARCNQALGARCGYINPLLYKIAGQPGKKSLRAVTHGNNGAYEARNGWSACTGLGTPRGMQLLAALRRGSQTK